jgi:G3E family GTPase
VTMVDAKHVLAHLHDSNEVREQIAFADVVILNKTDLVDEIDLALLDARIRSMNSAAKVLRAQNAAVDMDEILDVGAFTLARAQAVDAKFLEPEHPFEWAGIFSFYAGTAQLKLQPGPDAAMKIVVRPVEHANEAALEATYRDVTLAFSSDPMTLQLRSEPMSFPIEIAHAGYYAIYSEHRPEEYDLAVVSGETKVAASFSRYYKPDHEHDRTISSVGIEHSGPIDADRFNEWLRDLVARRGQDIFRMKGVLNVSGHDRRWIFQGVHMLVRGGPDREWKDGPRRNALVFIGRNLDRAELIGGFEKCLA